MKLNSDKNKKETDNLMEYLRKNPPRVKSINEVVNLLHVISAEQRSCNVLRSCVDKVLMNMSNIRTLRDIIERLRSVSRTNGFRLELPSTATPETRCQLVSDMFSVKIVLGTSNTDHSPIVLDVSIKHKEDYRSCPHLANIIRAGKFLELSNHLKGLMEMYSVSGSRQSRTKVYMALQSLETDLVKMSQMHRETHKDASTLDVTMEGMVGFLTPRLAGNRSHFAYYISPYDLIDTSANCRITLDDNVPKHIGLHAEVSIEQRASACNLPISPLITNKHPIDSCGMPRFMDISHHNTTMVQACFVLHLKPAIPVLSKVVEDIRKITNIRLSTEDNTPKRYLELLNAEKNTFKVSMGEECHIYHLDISELKGTMVNKVYFTHPGHVIKILDQLRKQAHLNTLISSCIRDLINVPKKGREWYFEVSCSKDISTVNVTMEHPSSRGTAFVEIRLDRTGFSGCKIFTGRGDPPLCSDLFVDKVLRKCSSLPITMRKLIEQSIKNPKKESDVSRARPPALFAPSTHPAPNLLATVPKPPVGLQRIPSTSVTPTFVGTAPHSFPFTPVVETKHMPKKCVENPMLTKLLIPIPGVTSEMVEPPDQPIKNHPMLLTLLKEDSDQEQPSLPHQAPPRTGRLMNSQMGPGNQLGMMGNVLQNQFNPTPNANHTGFMSPNSTYSNLDPPIPVPASHTMPPPSYPSPHPQNQFTPQGQLPSMSPAHVPHSPYSSQRSPMGGMEDMTGPHTPTHPFGMMSPGMVSPRGRRGSRQKSHSIENHDFPGFDIPQYDSQMSMESDTSISELLGMQNMQNRPGMAPLRRADSMSPGVSMGQHMPLQHSSSMKSENTGKSNLLTRSASVSSVKSGRSMMSPGPRNLRTPEAMMTLGSPPMFDVNYNQRGSRAKSSDSHISDFFRSPHPSASPGSIGGMNMSLNVGLMHDQESDPFTFDDNKNPSKISMPESTVAPASRTARPTLFQTTSVDKDKEETLRELAKTKPVLLKALTCDAPNIKLEAQTSLRQLGISTSGTNMSPGVVTQASNMSFDLHRLMTSTSVSTVNDKGLVRQNAIEKPGTSGTQAKSGDAKSEKTVKRRNSGKNEEGKPPAKKRGRPPTIKDHTVKRKKGDAGGSMHDDPGSNPSITLNIQLSSTGAPISSTTKTKPILGSTPPHKNQPSGNSTLAAPGNGGNTMNNITIGGTPATADMRNLENYLKSQEEFRKRKEMKEKKGVGKALSTKQSLGGQTSGISGAISNDKTQSNVQSAKPGSSPRSSGGPPAQRKSRKASIRDVVERLRHSSIPETTNSSTGSSPPDNTKQAVEKDANSNLLPKTKPLLSNTTYQKLVGSGGTAKTLAKASTDDKIGKTALGQKSGKTAPAKITPNMGLMAKPTGFTVAPQAKEAMDQVLKNITEAAAQTAKNSRVTTPISKPGPPAKVPRPPPAPKARSVTPTSVPTASNAAQRRSPSSQMLKTPPDVTGRSLPLKMGSNPTAGNSNTVKKSPLRNTSSIGVDPPITGKPTSTSPTAALMSLSRKVTSGDQHFVAPSISPTPKRTSSPLFQRNTSPMTRLDEKSVKGMPGRSPLRPSPTNSRISTPVPSGSPQSPDDRLMIIDDSGVAVPGGASMMAAQLSRDEQRPVFILGNRARERSSPERTVMPSPLSPPPVLQKSSTGLMLAAKRAPTPRSNITSPVMSPPSSSSPFIIDDDLMNQAVTG